MNRFTFKSLGRALSVLAVAGVVTVGWVGCGGGDDNPADNSGNSTGGNNTGGNNTGSNTGGGGTASWNNNDGSPGSFKEIDIGDQTWMDRDMNVKISGKSKCHANADTCNMFGRKYTWEDATTLCPAGWKLPDTTDLKELFAAVGGINAAGDKLKAKNGWKSGGNGSDEFGFAAYPGGYWYTSSNGSNYFSSGGTNGYWWSATESGRAQAYYLGMAYGGDNASYKSAFDKDRWLSVRCLKTTQRSWGEWVVTTPPTCSTTGVETRTDKDNPNHKQTREVPKLTGAVCVGGTVFTDERDGTKYGAVVIGGIRWMAENLKFETPNSGCYDNKPANCETFGRRYTWDEAMTVCPNGWSLPDTGDIRLLINGTGDPATAGKKLKSKTGWFISSDRNGSGTDEFGFAALPNSAYSRYETSDAGDGYWWMSTDYDKDRAYYLNLNWALDSARIREGGKTSKNYVRCREGAWGEWVVTTPPTCDAPGVETRTDSKNPTRKQTREVPQLKGRVCVVVNNGKFTDARDGKEYKAVEIGGKLWMAENLNYERSGFCYYSAPDSCAKYGRLYGGEECPKNWHLPSQDEFKALITAAGGEDVAGKALKSTDGWKDRSDGSSGNGTDDFGFSALPGGYATGFGNVRNSIGSIGRWSTSGGYYQFTISKDSDYARFEYYAQDSYDSYSVRCVADD